MPHHRNTINVATSALFFVCLMLHAQAGLSSQAFTPYNDAEAYKVYESLLPADWTVTVARARRLLIQAQGSSTDVRPNPSPESAALRQPLFGSFAALNRANWLLQPKFNLAISASREDLQSFFKPGDDGGTFRVLEKRDGLWKNMRWMGTSCAWAS
jgi:hypothetical protein